MVLEKTLESPLDCKEIQPVHPKGDQSWVFIGRTDVEAETPIIWPPDAKSWLIEKDPDAGKDWGQEKGTTEDKVDGCLHRLNGHGFGWTLGVGDGQGGLACRGSWGRKESNTTERLNWTELNWKLFTYPNVPCFAFTPPPPPAALGFCFLNISLGLFTCALPMCSSGYVASLWLKVLNWPWTHVYVLTSYYCPATNTSLKPLVPGFPFLLMFRVSQCWHAKTKERKGWYRGQK